MKKHYDFSTAKQVTIRLDQDAIAYFQKLAEETGIPYQTLINLYLKDCAASGKRLQLLWRGKTPRGRREESQGPD